MLCSKEGIIFSLANDIYKHNHLKQPQTFKSNSAFFLYSAVWDLCRSINIKKIYVNCHYAFIQWDRKYQRQINRKYVSFHGIYKIKQIKTETDW